MSRHTVLRERQLGPTKSALVYGGLDERDRRQARDAGLDLGPVALQDLFVRSPRRPEDRDERPHRRPDLVCRPAAVRHPAPLPAACLAGVRRRGGRADLGHPRPGDPEPQRLGPGGDGYGIGFNGLPFVGAVVDVAELSPAVCLAGLLPGAAVTWALVRDLPIRNRTA